MSRKVEQHLKKQLHNIKWIIFLITTGALLTGCTVGKQASTEEMMRVSVILPHSDDDYWSRIERGIMDNISLAEENHINIKMYVPQLNYNVEQMTDILKQQIAEKVDVIVVQGNEAPDFLKALYEAYDQGIQIICVDTDLPDFADHLYIGTDNFQAGLTLGQNIVKMVGDKADITVMSGEKGYPNLEERIAGMEEAFTATPQVKIKEVLYDNYDGMTFMKRYNESENNDTLVCIEGTGAQTLTRIFTEKDDHFQHIFGFDITTGIPLGVVEGILTQNNEEMGKCVVEELVHYRTTGSYSTDHIFTDTTWITRDNYDRVTDADE